MPEVREELGLPIDDLVTRLRDILGVRLVGYIGGVKSGRSVSGWADGKDTPGEKDQQRLRHAYYVAALLRERYDIITIQTWFKGVNASLDDEAPAQVLRDGEPAEVAHEVLAAAQSFLGEKEHVLSRSELSQRAERGEAHDRGEHMGPRTSDSNEQGLPARESYPDVPSFLRALPIGATFTHGNPNALPDSWVKVADDSYRRTYDWLKFPASDFASWPHVELTEPLPFSISQEEADRREAEARSRPPRNEMGG